MALKRSTASEDGSGAYELTMPPKQKDQALLDLKGASETDHARDPDPEKATTGKSAKKKGQGGKA